MRLWNSDRVVTHSDSSQGPISVTVGAKGGDFLPILSLSLLGTSPPAVGFAGDLAWPLEFIIHYCILERLFSLYFLWNEMKRPAFLKIYSSNHLLLIYFLGERVLLTLAGILSFSLGAFH